MNWLNSNKLSNLIFGIPAAAFFLIFWIIIIVSEFDKLSYLDYYTFSNTGLWLFLVAVTLVSVCAGPLAGLACGRIKSKAIKVLVGFLCLALIVVLCFVSFFSVLFDTGVSQTDDLENYLVYEKDDTVYDEYLPLLPQSIPHNAADAVYDYCYMTEFLSSGYYVYAAWVLSLQDFDAEKERVIQCFQSYEYNTFTSDGKEIFVIGKEGDSFEIGFDDNTRTVTYHRNCRMYGADSNPYSVFSEFEQ